MARRPADRPGPSTRDDAGVVIPLRSFVHAKERLAGALSHDARAALVREMADRVVRAAAPRPIVVVTDALEVAAWAREYGLSVIADPGSLDAAATAGREWVREQGLSRVVVVHADLPLASSLDAVADDGNAPVAVIVPDHRDDGTPVLSLPVSAPFEFAYGPGSAALHAAEARRCGLEVRIVRDAELGFDVDVEDDLRTLDRRRNPLP